ncbi:general stress protein [Pseudalkalibacillus caeni]|uniref:General stress protein n=1 Tax=Exobacillus caeni TaxID=2574798 RepID=A0A5R9EZ80_9BACL|nr:general stress protein [Pseudalkalibacillus caeni]TLS36602.1 general stress protein [Pseudalkalibacillus caeni]
MKPLVREYQDTETLKQDVEALKDRGVDKENIYIMSHDQDRTDRLADEAEANTVGMKELGLESVGTMFEKKGDELRKKMEELGLSESEAERYESEMDKGKVFVFCTDQDQASGW